MEADPLPDAPRSDVKSPAVLRSVTLSTPDFDASVRYFAAIFGTPPSEMELHADKDEALWGLDGATCRRAVFHNGDILLEIAGYEQPSGDPWPEGYRICDIGILNVGIGLSTREGHASAHARALAFGAHANRKPLHFGVCGLVYMNDAMGFSAEILWAGKGVDFGFKPSPVGKSSQPCNAEITLPISLPATLQEVQAALSADDFRAIADSVAVLAGEEEGNRTAIDIASDGDGRFSYRSAHSGRFAYHLGEINCWPDGEATRLNWRIRFRSKYPATAWFVKRTTERRLRRVLRDMAIKSSLAESGGNQRPEARS